MEISEEDLQLINALQIAPRISWSDAAGILGVHATTLAARWERLKASGAAWSTAHLMGDPKQMCLALVDVDCEMTAARRRHGRAGGHPRSSHGGGGCQQP